MKVLLAVDGSEGSEVALNAVIDQFEPARTKVQVLHADDWPNGLPASLTFAEGPEATADILRRHETRRLAADVLVARVASRLRTAGFVTTTTVREGDAQRTILQCAADWHPDLIVLGSHGRRGFDRLILGSVSEGVAHRAPCSVEITRGRHPAG
jgi:nucleotide-binding universal stress UspA family protein